MHTYTYMFENVCLTVRKLYTSIQYVGIFMYIVYILHSYKVCTHVYN